MSASPQASIEPKLIYFAQRCSGMDALAFRRRWREHARLGMSMPRWRNIRRYAHCDAFEVERSKLPIGWCDGVATLSYRNESCRFAHVTDASAAPQMKRDEAETFAHPVREAAILADELVFERSRSATTKLFLRLRRSDQITREEFRDWWSIEAGNGLRDSLLASGMVTEYIQNHARLEEAEYSPPSLCDCVDEIGSYDIDACESALLQVFAGLPGFARHVGGCSAIWTVETVLHDCP